MAITRTIAAIIAAVLWAGLAAPASAQLQFDELGNRLPVDNDVTFAVALGDVDGDGDPDLVFGNGEDFVGFGQQNRLYLNDGAGTYTDATAARMPSVADNTNGLALGDVDGDGDLDLAVANGGIDSAIGHVGQSWLYLNDGTGAFSDATATHMPSYIGGAWAVELGDVDSDGDLDMVLAGAKYVAGTSLIGQNRLYLNDGSGVFSDVTATQLPPNFDNSYAVALGDVDGDGDCDLVFGTRMGLDRLYLNDGSGTFADVTASRMPTYSGRTYAVALGDVDGDGDQDLVLGTAHTQDRLYLNNGTGTFSDATASRMPAESVTSLALALGDVDGDGDLDMVFGNGGQQNRLYLNDGTGTFSDATASRMPAESVTPLALALGDVDGDGDGDLVFGNCCYPREQNRLYLNLLRQLDAPFLARVGFTYQLDVYARYGPTRDQDVAQPWLATGTASIPIPPIGTFGLDPTQMIALPRVVVPQPGGMASLSFTIPNVPSLSGVAIYAQALLVHDPVTLPAILTNVTADVVQ